MHPAPKTILAAPGEHTTVAITHTVETGHSGWVQYRVLFWWRYNVCCNAVFGYGVVPSEVQGPRKGPRPYA